MPEIATNMVSPSGILGYIYLLTGRRLGNYVQSEKSEKSVALGTERSGFEFIFTS